jgi:hypothetical protein
MSATQPSGVYQQCQHPETVPWFAPPPPPQSYLGLFLYNIGFEPKLKKLFNEVKLAPMLLTLDL